MEDGTVASFWNMHECYAVLYLVVIPHVNTGHRLVGVSNYLHDACVDRWGVGAGPRQSGGIPVIRIEGGELKN